MQACLEWEKLMSLFYKQNAAARYFVDQANGEVYEVVGGSAALLCW